MFKLGIENFIQDTKQHKNILKLAVLVHPASVTQNLKHSVDEIAQCSSLNLSAIFSPQHGFQGEKQDNMIESDHSHHSVYNIPIFSLYKKNRRPTAEMMSTFDTLAVDLQDVGCRIYTYLTTLIYMIEACEQYKKNILIFDRPNPIGRSVEGFILDMKLKSFVGAAPIILKHGLTLGEAALWYVEYKKLSLNIQIVKMSNYKIATEPWPKNLSWINPSPNLPRLSSTYIYPGSVLLEGSLLSEGRGTTRPFETIGAPDIDFKKVYKKMLELQKTLPIHWTNNCEIRLCNFEPQFQKHKHKLCSGLQFHTDTKNYNHNQFKPFRLICLLLKAIRLLYPQYNLWTEPPYEYEDTHKPFNIISGDLYLLNWIEDSSSDLNDLDKTLCEYEQKWSQISRPYFLY